MHLSQNITSTSYFDMREAVSKRHRVLNKIHKNPKTCDMQEAVSNEKSKEFTKNSDNSEKIP